MGQKQAAWLWLREGKRFKISSGGVGWGWGWMNPGGGWGPQRRASITVAFTAL